jgi:chromosome segregation and condensation protein ScpB
MEKRISFDEFQSVKRVAQACNPLKAKRDKVMDKINALQAEYKSYDTQISALETGIKSIIGFRTEELVKKVIESGLDKNGKETKATKYVPTDIVTYDKDHKQYVINIPDEEPNTENNSSEDNTETTND